MSKTLKKQIFFLTIIILNFSFCRTHRDHESLGPLTSKFVKKCNQDLLKGYGLRGLTKPTRMDLTMCPTIVHSCCTQNDQLTIYANWIHSKERHEIVSKLELSHRVHKKTLDLMVRTTKLARKIAHKLRDRPVSNCGMLAKKINLFQIDASEEIILKAFDQMQKFITKSYDGFYCAICDHKNHRYFDIDQSLVNYGIDFCRETVENTLIPALYININFKEMINAVTRFVTSCDFKGTFTRDLPIPVEFQFDIVPKVAKSLLECRDSRNKKQWFVECEPLCQEMSLYKISHALVPNVKKLAKYNIHLESQLKRINNDARLRVISGLGGTKGKLKKSKKKKKSKKHALRERILSDSTKKESEGDKKRRLKKEKKKKQKTRKQLYKERGLIFFTQRAHSFVQQNTKYYFIEGGMNLFHIGKSSRITDGVFNQVKTSISLDKLGMEKAASYGIKVKQSGIFRKNISIKNTFILLSLLFLAAKFY